MQKSLVVVFLVSYCLFIHGSPKFVKGYPFLSCSNATFSANSTYFSNLKALSSALSSKASGKFYHKSSVGRPSNNLTAYGAFQCRGDLNASACRQCVATATSNSSQQYCPLSVGAVLWFDECFLRYSNQSFFSILTEDPSLTLVSSDEIEDDVYGFDQVVGSTLNHAVANASSNSVRLFGTKEARFRNETVYTLAQCTQDLSTSNCGKCLRNALQYFPADCCSGKKGGRILFPSCTIRYELYEFYTGVSLSPSPSPASSISTPPAAESAPPLPASSLPSSPSSPVPSTAASVLTGKERATVLAMVITGIIVAGYFL